MSIKSKKQIAAELIKTHQHLLRCPICHSHLQSIREDAIICTNNHCFNISKRGYVNLNNKNTDIKYNNDMFKARRSLYSQHFLQHLEKKIIEIIINLNQNSQNTTSILDAGCGEGYILSNLVSNLSKRQLQTIGVGFDIAKPGIDLAARDFPGHIWLAADISNPPFGDSQFDFIINVLSPANYEQFTRILKPKGFVIKIVPGKNYLQELRTHLYPDEADYSNEQVIQLFKQHLNLIDTYKITDKLQLNEQLASDLLTMTPLTWGTTIDYQQSAIISKLHEITIDIEILVGSNPQT